MVRLSTLIFTMMIGCTAMAQIPNASFESWTAATGYSTPDGWGNTNPYTGLSGTYTCEKGTSGAPDGTSYLKLTSKTVLTAVVPGVAVTGSIIVSGTSYSVSGGFASSARPASLTGSWQYMATPPDQGRIVVFLSKWNFGTNKRDTVSFTDYPLPTMVMVWTTFSIPLTYQRGSVPDTALILVSASGTTPVANSYLWLDKLAFAGNVPSGVVTVKNNREETTVYPNPATGAATIYYYSLFSSSAKVVLTDMGGRTVRTYDEDMSSGANYFELDLSGLVKGNYLATICNGLGTETKKIEIR